MAQERKVRSGEHMRRSDSGSILLSVSLFMITLAMTINMTIDFFRLNISAQVVTEQRQDKMLLKRDLENQVKIVSSIRRSLNDPNNSTFKACLLAACTHATPQGFFLSSPMSPLLGKPDLTIAGPTGSPAAYSTFGERCAALGPSCDNLAYAFYNISGSDLKVWVVVKPQKSSTMPALNLLSPSATIPLAKVFATY